MSETRGIPACDLTARNVADTVLSCINGDMSPYPAFSLGMAVPYATDTLRRRGGVVSRGDAVAAAARQAGGYVKVALLLGYPHARFFATRDFDGHAMHRRISRHDVTAGRRARFALVEAVLDNGDRFDLTARDIGTYLIANR